MASRNESNETLEAAVLKILESSEGPYGFGQLEETVRQGCSSELRPLAVREAAWNLIEQNRAVLAPGFRVGASHGIKPRAQV